MMAQIIPFPERPRPSETIRFLYLNSTGITMSSDNNECTEDIHFFTSKSLPCHCGQEVWPERMS